VEAAAALHRELRLPLGEAAYAGLAKAALRAGAPPAAIDGLIYEMLGRRLRPGPALFTHLAYACALHGDDAGALAALERAKAAGLAPGQLLYHHVLRACGATGNVEGASRVLRDMAARGVRPSAGTYARAFSAAWVRAEGARIAAARALAAVPAGARREARLQTLGRRAAEWAGAYRHLVSWQRSMVAAGLRHDAASLSYLLEALAAMNRLTDALALADASDARGALLPGGGERGGERGGRGAAALAGAPREVAARIAARRHTLKHVALASSLSARVVAAAASGGGGRADGGGGGGAAAAALSARRGAHAALLATFGLNRSTAAVEAALKRLEAGGAARTFHTWQLLLYVRCAAAQWGPALETLDAMRREGHPPREDTWHVVCRALADAGAPAKAARAVLAGMDEATRHRFDQLYGLTAAASRREEPPPAAAVEDGGGGGFRGGGGGGEESRGGKAPGGRMKRGGRAAAESAASAAAAAAAAAVDGSAQANM